MESKSKLSPQGKEFLEMMEGIRKCAYTAGIIDFSESVKKVLSERKDKMVNVDYVLDLMHSKGLELIKKGGKTLTEVHEIMQRRKNAN